MVLGIVLRLYLNVKERGARAGTAIRLGDQRFAASTRAEVTSRPAPDELLSAVGAGTKHLSRLHLLSAIPVVAPSDRADQENHAPAAG